MFKERVHKPFNKHVDYFCNEPVNHLRTVDFHKKKKTAQEHVQPKQQVLYWTVMMTYTLSALPTHDPLK